MKDWEEAWLNGRAMPPHNLSRDLLIFGQELAEQWNDSDEFCENLEQWILKISAGQPLLQERSFTKGALSKRSMQLMSDLLWNGFRIRVQKSGKRVLPVPVLIKLLYSQEYLRSRSDVEKQMQFLFADSLSEWLDQFQKYGDKLVGAS